MNRKINYDWDEIQVFYDNNHSFRDITREYGVSSKLISNAVKRCRFKSRSHYEGVLLWNKLGNNKGGANNLVRSKKASDRIEERYKNSWMPKAGRCEKIRYLNKYTGKIVSLDGTWEFKTAKYFDSLNLRWYRNTKKFPYTDMSNVNREYTPDFYVENWEAYVEIKGYKTELDVCKWRYFPFKLLIWDKTVLKRIKII